MLIKLLNTFVLITALLVPNNSYAGPIALQESWEVEGTSSIVAAALNLGGGQVCLVNTVGRPHLLPSEFESADLEDLQELTKESQEMVDFMMSQYPLCTQAQEARIERAASSTHHKDASLIKYIPIFNVTNPSGTTFKTILLPEHMTLIMENGTNGTEGQEGGTQVQRRKITLSGKLPLPARLILGCAFGAGIAGTVYFYTLGNERRPWFIVAGGVVASFFGLGFFGGVIPTLVCKSAGKNVLKRYVGQ